jgi:phosphoribosylanthranilate isomerase
MPLLVKICGLKTPDALDAALEAGADLVGFVFFGPSPRNVSYEAARALGERVMGRAAKVALTVDADDATFERIVAALKPDMLQLHGKESPEQVRVLKKKFDLPVMKAIPVETADDLAAVAVYEKAADRLLFDARAPREATRPGGLGKAFDWTLLRNLNLGIPYMLSGGLDPDNVADALRITRAPGVDVSSGVERVPGEKDPDKIRAFVRAARAADCTVKNSKVASSV